MILLFLFLKTYRLLHFSGINDVPEVLNVHVNENNLKNLLFLEVFFFQVVKN